MLMAFQSIYAEIWLIHELAKSVSRFMYYILGLGKFPFAYFMKRTTLYGQTWWSFQEAGSSRKPGKKGETEF